MLRRKIYIILILLSLFNSTVSAGNKVELKEYKVKAAFIYNFLKFAKWPENKFESETDPIKIVIVGAGKYREVFQVIAQKKAGNRSIYIQFIRDYNQLQNIVTSEDNKDSFIESSHMLFICDSQKKHLSQIAKKFPDRGVLIVTESSNALDKSSMVNFIKFDNKICFEMNLDNCQKADIAIRSKLVRLAKRVINTKNKVDDK